MKKGQKQQKNWSYEVTIADIEETIQQIESSSLPLEEVFEKFAIATKQLQDCEAFLSQGKHQVSLLIETLGQELDF
jgi:exodeoxyribonuclease VII small subunit